MKKYLNTLLIGLLIASVTMLSACTDDKPSESKSGKDENKQVATSNDDGKNVKQDDKAGKDDKAVEENKEANDKVSDTIYQNIMKSELSDKEKVVEFVSVTNQFLEDVDSFGTKIENYTQDTGIAIDKPLLTKLLDEYIYFPTKENFVLVVGRGVKNDNIIKASLFKDKKLDDFKAEYSEKQKQAQAKYLGKVSLKSKEITDVYEESGIFTVLTKFTYNADAVNFEFAKFTGSHDFDVYRKFVFVKNEQGDFVFNSFSHKYYMADYVDAVTKQDIDKDDKNKDIDEEKIKELRKRDKEREFSEFTKYNGEPVQYKPYE